ncbi:MAG: tripartite tricarboxylate transporter substrate binding protein [Betaproteobacteria bacterium]|nr:tripartite tricarboxylate transporter substrate binding protein [Betaproteobacteria bacterium]
MIKMISRWIAASATVLLACTSAIAQPYPNKPVKMVVGFVPGGAPDFLARVLSTKLSESLGQAFVVENKPGAGGSLSTAFVAKAPADGYTLLLAETATLMLAPHLFKGAPADTLKDFVAVGSMTTDPPLLVSNAKTSIKTLQDLIRQAKANPGKISYGSSGIGSIHHIAMEAFRVGAGLDIAHIPYKGSGQSILAVLSGDVPIIITAFTAAGPHILSGAINLLAVGTGQRLASHPDVPSLSEVVKDYDYSATFGVLAPAGTPPDIVAKLSRAMKQAAETPDFIDKFKAQASVIKWTSPDEYRDFLRENQKKYDRAAKLANLQPN